MATDVIMPKESVNPEPLVHHSDAKGTGKKNDFMKISPAARRIARAEIQILYKMRYKNKKDC